MPAELLRRWCIVKLINLFILLSQPVSQDTPWLCKRSYIIAAVAKWKAERQTTATFHSAFVNISSKALSFGYVNPCIFILNSSLTCLSLFVQYRINLHSFNMNSKSHCDNKNEFNIEICKLRNDFKIICLWYYVRSRTYEQSILKITT